MAPGEKSITVEAGKILPTSIQEKETHWLKRALSPIHTKQEQEGLVGILRIAGSTQLQNLVARSCPVFSCAPSG
eukprot:1145246-Pelagomonas_calceolata.AAC.3